MSDLQNLYQQIILDHAKAKHGSANEPLGSIEQLTIPPHTHYGQSHQINTTCGDDVTLRVIVRVDPPTPEQKSGFLATGLPVASPGDPRATLPAVPYLNEVIWSGDGCSISMASASVLSDLVTALPVTEARALLVTFREMLRSRGTIEPDEEVLGDASAFGGVSRYPARVKCAMLPWVAFEAALLQLR